MFKDVWVRFIFIFIISCSLFYDVNSQCTTPDGDAGNCISLIDCPELLNLLVNSTRPHPPAIKEKLQRSQCGYSGRYPEVCCAKKENTDTGSRFKLDPISIPDVSGHNNLELLPTDCGETSVDRIVGGNETELFEFPWMALIAYANGGPNKTFDCGGTIINSRYILTAAHCIITAKGNPREIVSVRVGEHDTSTEEDCYDDDMADKLCTKYQDIGIEEAIFYPGYSSERSKGDIGLIRLNRAINLTDNFNMRAICLPISLESSELIKKDTNLVVAGWGKTKNASSSSKLLKVLVPVVDTKRCKQTYRRQLPTGIDATHICAGGVAGIDSCNGDSGGPLKMPTRVGPTIRYVQFGIVSFGLRICGIRGYPGVYTSTAYYMDWILDSLKP